MKIKDILSLIDKSNKEYDVDLTSLAEELGHEYRYDSTEYDENIEVYWLSKWLCTDTEVGQRVYILNNEPVCYSQQSARKEDEVFYFFDEDCVVKLKNYFFNREIELYKGKVRYKGYDEELSTVYKVDYNDHLGSQTQGYIKDDLVEVVELINNDGTTCDKVKVKYSNGDVIDVSVRELNIPIYLTEEYNDSLEPFYEGNEFNLKEVEDEFEVVDIEEYIKLIENGTYSTKDEVCIIYTVGNNQKKLYKLKRFKNAQVYIQNLNSLFEYYTDVYGGDFEKEFKDYVEFCKHLINDDVYSRYIKGNKKLSKVRDLEFKVISNSKK